MLRQHGQVWQGGHLRGHQRLGARNIQPPKNETNFWSICGQHALRLISNQFRGLAWQGGHLSGHKRLSARNNQPPKNETNLQSICSQYGLRSILN